MSKYYILAEAGGKLGFGHLIRSYSLSQRLKIDEEINCLIKYHGDKKSIQNLNLFRNIFFVNDEKDCQNIIKNNSLIIVDGYSFDIGYLNFLNQNGNRVIFIADIHKIVPNCKAIINHLPWVNKNKYNQNKIDLVLVGIEYAILRKEFYNKPSEHKNKFFICLGNTAVDKQIISIYNALKSIGISDDLIEIVYKKKIESLPIEIKSNQSSDQIFKLISDSEFCFVTPGNISYEIFSINRNCIMGYVNESQKAPLEKFGKLGLSYDIGNWSEARFDSIKTWLTNSKKTTKIQNLHFNKLRENIHLEKLKNLL